MKVDLPTTETKIFKIAPEFEKTFETDKLTVTAVGEFRGDIKWNDSALCLKWSIVGGTDLASVQLVRFTGNCGVKAMSHLSIIYQMTKHTTTILEFIESFAFHRLNCGLLVGSDTINGNTISLLEKYGKNYITSEPVWNPNYTWDHKHKIALFHKDLTKTKYPDYFVQ